MSRDTAQIAAAEVVLPCRDVDPTLEFLVGLGFVVDTIFPADRPTVVVVSGYGLRLRLDANASGPAGVLRLRCADPRAVFGGETLLVAPNGTKVELVAAEPALLVPPLQAALVVTHMDKRAAWGVGRAGMEYRDLIPDRQGGRFIASHIRIPGGGPVPDYVHFHRIRFQLIYCYRGWVRVAYEDQGTPLLMQAGDCFLQPPLIRHRVLECSPGFEVIEISCPAEHETLADHDMELPTPTVDRDRDFGGQRFVHHVAAEASWGAWRSAGFEARDLGIGAATNGLAGVRVARATGDAAVGPGHHDGELMLLFLLEGAATLTAAGSSHVLAPGACAVIPAGLRHGLEHCASDTQLLEVTLPATPTFA